MAKPLIRVFCIDDHPLVLEGITGKINQQPDMKIVGAASSGEQGLELFREQRPDVTLVDLHLPGVSGSETIKMIRRVDAEAKTIVVSMLQGEEDVFRALQAGAVAFVSKKRVADDLIGAIRQVYAGERSIPPEVASQVAARLTQPALTQREVHILELVALGMRNKEIGASLNISQDTVEAHVRNIFGKLQVHDRTAAVTVALKRGIIHI